MSISQHLCLVNRAVKIKIDSFSLKISLFTMLVRNWNTRELVSKATTWFYRRVSLLKDPVHWNLQERAQASLARALAENRHNKGKGKVKAKLSGIAWQINAKHISGNTHTEAMVAYVQVFHHYPGSSPASFKLCAEADWAEGWRGPRRRRKRREERELPPSF